MKEDLEYNDSTTNSLPKAARHPSPQCSIRTNYRKVFGKEERGDRGDIDGARKEPKSQTQSKLVSLFLNCYL